MEIEYARDENGIQIDYTTLTPRFSVNNQQSFADGIEYLNAQGYAVFSDVMSEEEIVQNKNLLWNFLENIPDQQIRRDQPDSWSRFWPGIHSHGVVNHAGVGQSDFMWNVRSNRRIKEIYSRIWNTNELLVSFDGCGLFRDWRYQSSWKTRAGWYHVDQNPIQKPNRCCVQGFASLTDQNATTGGLIVFPRTHLRFTEMQNVARRPRDFIIIRQNHSILNFGRAIGKLVQCQRGDFVVWDSRLVHCNAPAFHVERRLQNDPVDLLRIVAYVSMSPTSFIDQRALERFRKERKRIVAKNGTLTHWSTELVEPQPNEILPRISPSKFNSYQRSLIIGTDDTDESND